MTYLNMTMPPMKVTQSPAPHAAAKESRCVSFAAAARPLPERLPRSSSGAKSTPAARNDTAVRNRAAQPIFPRRPIQLLDLPRAGSGWPQPECRREPRRGRRRGISRTDLVEAVFDLYSRRLLQLLDDTEELKMAGLQLTLTNQPTGQEFSFFSLAKFYILFFINYDLNDL